MAIPPVGTPAALRCGVLAGGAPRVFAAVERSGDYCAAANPRLYPWFTCIARDILIRMNGVTTAIVAFCFVCVALPSLVKNRTQYYVGLTCIIGVIFLDATGRLFPNPAYDAFVYCMCALLQIMAVLMLVLAAGGLTMKEFSHDLRGAFEVIRRGEETSSVVIPRPAPVRSAPAGIAPAVGPSGDPARIDPAPIEPVPEPARPARNPDLGPLPLI